MHSAGAESAHATDILCGDRPADFYALRSHVDGCGKRDKSGRGSAHRLEIGVDEDRTASVLLVARV